MITSTLLFGLVLMAGMTQTPTAAALPPVTNLPVIKELPDPFLFTDGTRVKTKKEWQKRRTEIKQLVQQYAYGFLPPASGHIEAEALSEAHDAKIGATERKVLLKMGPGGKVQVNLILTVPDGAKRFPAIIVGDLCWGKVKPAIVSEVVKHGYALAEFDRTEVAHDKAGRVGGVYDAYPEGNFGALAAWAWGYHRVVDYLTSLPNVDTKRIAITGHSRGGKAVLLAGALDERIALTAPNDAGCMGTGCTRFVYTNSETLPVIVKNFPYWFSPHLAEFVGHEEQLPFDQHTMKALVAPRALLETQALEDEWANPKGAQVTFQAARVVFDFLGAGDKICIAYRPGGHDQLLSDWQALLDFADHQFFHKAVARRFDELPYPDDSKRVYNWTAPGSK